MLISRKFLPKLLNRYIFSPLDPSPSPHSPASTDPCTEPASDTRSALLFLYNEDDATSGIFLSCGPLRPAVHILPVPSGYCLYLMEFLPEADVREAPQFHDTIP